MIKTITYLCVLLVLITGCSDDEKVPLTDYSNTYAYDVSILNYKFFNLEGIDLNSDFIDLYNGKVFQFSDGGRLEYLGSGKFNILGEEAYSFWESINDDAYSNTQYGQYRPDAKFLYMSGVRNNKIWIGKFDETNREQVDEWYCKDEIKNGIIKYDVGYGKEKSCKVKAVSVSEICDDYFQLDIRGDDFVNMLLLRDNLCGLYFESINNLMRWYNNSLLVCMPNYSNVYDTKGNEIIKYGKYIYAYYSIIPVTYSQFLRCTDTYIRLDDLTKDSDIWTVSVPRSYPNGTKINYEVINTSANIWKLLCTALKIDGSEDKIVFTVNLENGDIVVL